MMVSASSGWPSGWEDTAEPYSLFDAAAEEELGKMAPLAARMRPRSLGEVLGQSHIIGHGAALRNAFENGNGSSAILWGPPGSGKTTIARLLSEAGGHTWRPVSAVSSGVSELRQEIASAKEDLGTRGRRSVLFVDEIHRFNRAQQDALLPAVEDGTVILIGATTENPYFYVVSPLLSRALLFRLDPLGETELSLLVESALSDPRGFGGRLSLEEPAREFLVFNSGGDGRTALNSLELAAEIAESEGSTVIRLEQVRAALQSGRLTHDRSGDAHYDVVSAFIKSMRGSDPDAAIHWLARMIHAGEDPRFIARRMIVFASEDIGNADPDAITVAISAARAVEIVGMPEARINLAQAVAYLSVAPKDNAAYVAIDQALRDVEAGKTGPVPPHLRDSGYRGAEKLGHGEGYRYPHDYPEGVPDQDYFPEGMEAEVYYRPRDRRRDGNS